VNKVFGMLHIVGFLFLLGMLAFDDHCIGDMNSQTTNQQLPVPSTPGST
jgi:hypothetical protein